ncbi:MAG TPA: phosphopantetheine-binding protein [Gemmatimonadales bacterium]|nr:phosphopantetheine-binding protein [Gemmatimonadales bacterium]
MTSQEIRTRVLDCLVRVAPEVDPASIKPGVPLRDQLDIDSMDFLRFVIELDEALHVAVPESDYPEIATLDSCVRYLSARVPTTPAG